MEQCRNILKHRNILENVEDMEIYILENIDIYIYIYTNIIRRGHGYKVKWVYQQIT